MTDPKKLLDKAKINLIMSGSVFITTIAFSLRYKFTTDVPIGAVDGTTIFLNPDYFVTLTDDQRAFLIGHEAWHVALNHIIRGNGYDQQTFNSAADYVINQLQVDAGMEMLPVGLQDDKYRGMSTLQIYKLLMEDKQNNPPPPPSDFEGDIIPSDDPTGELENELKRILVSAVTQSEMAGEDAGAIPGDIRRQLDELLNPVLPWESLLHRFLTEKVNEDYTWRRPNRRFIPDLYLPTQYSEALGHITIAIDTSGSISKADLTAILSEIVYIKERFKPEKLTILDCDNKIHHIHDVQSNTDILDLVFTGGGGTSFHPVIAYCKAHETTALLYFTDLYAAPITEEQPYPVMWLCYSDHKASPTGETVYFKPNNA